MLSSPTKPISAMGSSASASASVTIDAASVATVSTFNPCFPTFFDVVGFLDVCSAMHVASLSKLFHATLLQDHNFWRLLCKTVSATGRLYFQPEIHAMLAVKTGDEVGHWTAQFRIMWQRRNMWAPASLPETDTETESGVAATNGFSINVCARFRPLVESAGGHNAPTTVVLPLHQKIAMIRQRAKIEEGAGGAISKKEAFSRLMTEMSEKGVGMGLNAAKDSEAGDVVMVEGRGRWQGNVTNPPVANTSVEAGASTEEKPGRSADIGVQTGVLSVNASTSSVLTAAAGCGLREFHFDAVMDEYSIQRDVFEINAAPLLADFVNGVNVTMLMFGQTGSGKTFTMFGGHFLEGLESQSESLGMIPRVCNELIASCAAREAELGITFKLAVSYVEIFGDEVHDLIRADEDGPSQIMVQNAAAAQRFVLEGYCDRPVATLTEVQDVLKTGEQRKRKAATAMNEHSSRAHTLFILSLEQSDRSGDIVHKSKMFLADLGGSEDLKKSKVNEGLVVTNEDTEVIEENLAQKERLKEAQNINYGLFALKMVIEALHKKKDHVPYHMSKLTLLLKDGLGGNSKTSVVVCAAPEPSNATESIQTLRFGEMCKSVKTTTKQTGAAFARAIKLLDSKIALCEEQIKKKEKWAKRSRWVESIVYGEQTLAPSEVVHVDINKDIDWDETKEEDKKTQRVVRHEVKGDVLVGAEEYREQLEELLAQKRKLLNIG